MASQLVSYSYRDTSQLEHAYYRALPVNTLSIHYVYCSYLLLVYARFGGIYNILSMSVRLSANATGYNVPHYLAGPLIGLVLGG